MLKHYTQSCALSFLPDCKLIQVLFDSPPWRSTNHGRLPNARRAVDGLADVQDLGDPATVSSNSPPCASFSPTLTYQKQSPRQTARLGSSRVARIRPLAARLHLQDALISPVDESVRAEAQSSATSSLNAPSAELARAEASPGRLARLSRHFQSSRCG